MNKQPLAHKKIDEQELHHCQLLTDHLLNVGNMAGSIGVHVELESLMTLIGYLHDLGKADTVFQDYLNGVTSKRVNHSSAGAKYLLYVLETDKRFSIVKNQIELQYFKEIMIYTIQSHHGLYDVVDINTYENRSIERLDYNKLDAYNFEEDVLEFAKIFNSYLVSIGKDNINKLIEQGYNEFKEIFTRIKQLAKQNPLSKTDKKVYVTEVQYYISCFTRLCVSILKEADIYDSANAFVNKKQKLFNQEELQNVWEEGYNNIEKIYKNYEKNPNPSKLNLTRTEMANKAKMFARQSKEGIYQLELPTGAGKTQASLRYALVNSREYQKQRIFYITAYLSVLEQNAKDIREIINNEPLILEHHSNVILDTENLDESTTDSKDYKDIGYLMDSWESPYILTTMVQFFNTLFKGQANSIRRFCKLINSVIIIDEVQSLPLKTMYNFNLMMNFMKTIMHCNIVHCTATQPYFDSKVLKYPIYYGDNNNNNIQIVDKDLSNSSCFNRVNYLNLTGKDAVRKISTDDLVKNIKTNLNKVNSCLVVLNTKAAVLDLYNALLDRISNVKIVYLTTNLCAAHRLNLIDEMKEILVENRRSNKQQRLICISTQLIEAGVDLDFDCVYRSMAGLDSIIQCAGRCNREGKLRINDQLAKGNIYIINYAEEKLHNLPDIKQTINASQEAIRSLKLKDGKTEIPIKQIKKHYFYKYYVENKSELFYWKSKNDSSMIDNLSYNSSRRVGHSQIFNRKYPYKIAQSFKTAADQFQLIENDTIPLLVYYQNHDLMDQLEEAIERRELKEISTLLKRLQRTTINVYPSKKLEPYISHALDGKILILNEYYYDEKLGIVTDGLVELII